MKIKEKWLIPLLGILMIAGSTPAFSQNKVGTTAAPFLTIGVGARPQAMGGALSPWWMTLTPYTGILPDSARSGE